MLRASLNSTFFMEKPAAQEQRNKHCQTYQSSLMSGQIPIVLTATVIPNGVTAAASDPEKRLREYMAAVAFYLDFASVFFLENSAYPLEKSKCVTFLFRARKP